MIKQDYPQFTRYDAETAIPGYQRAWVWGLVALAILLCGLTAGWLMARTLPPPPGTVPSHAVASPTGQEQINRRLRERIAQLEQALNGDGCGPEALRALAPDRQP